MLKITISILDWVTLLARLTYWMVVFGMMQLLVMSKSILTFGNQRRVNSSAGHMPEKFEQSALDTALQRHVWQGAYITTNHKK